MFNDLGILVTVIFLLGIGVGVLIGLSGRNMR